MTERLPTPDSRQVWLVAAALAGIAFLAFAPALRFEFVSLDDNDYVTQNPHVREGLSIKGLVRDFKTLEVANWHPLTWLSLQLDASLWNTSHGEPDPLGFHFTNVLLHAANAALLFLALRALTGAFWRCAAVAVLFAVHPLRVESVAWVAERKDVLSMFFGLLALWAYASYVREPSRRRYVVLATFFALSLMAKPMLVTLPFLLLVLDWWPLGRHAEAGGWWRLVREKLPLLALTVISSGITFLAQSRGGATHGSDLYPFVARLENAVVSYVVYLAKTFWPFDLAPFYPHPGTNVVVWQVAGAGLVLVALTAGAVAFRRRAPYLLTGWLWYLGTLVPVIGLVQVGSQAYADRYSYFPQIGLLLAVCFAVADLSVARPRLALTAGIVAALALTVRSEDQLRTWQDSSTLWRHALSVTPPNPTSLISLGTVEEDRQNLDEAKRLYQEALAIDPGSALAHLNLGSLLARLGQPKEAIAELRAACEQAPDFARAHTFLGHALLQDGDAAGALVEHKKALKLILDSPESYQAIPQAYCDVAGDELTLDHLQFAAQLYKEATRHQPDMPEAHYWLASTLLRLLPNEKKPIAECTAHLRIAVELKPEFTDARVLLAQQLYRGGDLKGAVEHFGKVVELDPKVAKAWYGLGLCLARQGRLGDAEHCLSQAVELDHDSAGYKSALASVLDTLAVAQSGDGHLPDAIETERRAASLAEGQPELLSKIKVNLERLQRGETLRPPSVPAP